MSRAGAGVMSRHAVEKYRAEHEGKDPPYQFVELAVSAPVLTREERTLMQRGREAIQARVRVARLGVEDVPANYDAIPRKNAKRSRSVRAARARGDGPGMTNPHGYVRESA